MAVTMMWTACWVILRSIHAALGNGGSGSLDDELTRLVGGEWMRSVGCGKRTYPERKAELGSTFGKTSWTTTMPSPQALDTGGQGQDMEDKYELHDDDNDDDDEETKRKRKGERKTDGKE